MFDRMEEEMPAGSGIFFPGGEGAAKMVEAMLSRKINKPEINKIVAWVSGKPDNLSLLWRLGCSKDRRTGVNALWTLTHLPDSDSEWLLSIRDDIIDMLLEETDVARKRMMLQILRGQEYDADDIRTDFLDYCLSKINSECEPYAIRCFSIYAAFRMCRHYPELVAELESHLDMMRLQSLSPGLKSALRQTKAKIRRLRFPVVDSGTSGDRL